MTSFGLLGLLGINLGQPILLLIVLCGAAWIAGKYLFRADEAIEDRRRSAAQIAAELKQEGLSHVPELLIDYAVGDYSGMLARVKSWAEFIRDDDQRKAFFSKVLETQLRRSLEDPGRRQRVLEIVEEWRAADTARRERVKNGASAPANL